MAILLANFPPLTGRYFVGCHDIEWQNNEKQPPNSAFTSNTDNDPPSSPTEIYCKSVLMRLYYPATIRKGDHKANWITHPDYAKALCGIAKLPTFLSNWLSNLASIKKTRFYKDAQVLESEAPFPVIIFSHGLGGNRLVYSSICSDLASHGFIVAAIEHRDGSASLARGIEDEWVKYDNVPPEVWGFRHHQLRHRVSEIELCLAGLDEIARRGHHNNGGSNFKGKLNMKSLVMAGHSFGGATTMLMLNEKYTRFECGLLLDPWAQPLIMMTDKNVHIQRPVIAILSEQFSFWPDNYESVQELIDNSDFAKNSVCLTLNGTEHQHQSDVLLVLRYWTIFDFRSPFQIDPVRAIHLNTEAAVTFIKNVLSNPPSATTIAEKVSSSSNTSSDATSIKERKRRQPMRKSTTTTNYNLMKKSKLAL